jgi:hypothetical protein
VGVGVGHSAGSAFGCITRSMRVPATPTNRQRQSTGSPPCRAPAPDEDSSDLSWHGRFDRADPDNHGIKRSFARMRSSEDIDEPFRRPVATVKRDLASRLGSRRRTGCMVLIAASLPQAVAPVSVAAHPGTPPRHRQPHPCGCGVPQATAPSMDHLQLQRSLGTRDLLRNLVSRLK